ncbi:hypothetical protein, partial [Klebsiella pneumoniae]|uniref:hypothetical protein n=1 Tax=Klebsiella pneumoniae TaxID=573 RepID=UPI003F7622D4
LYAATKGYLDEIPVGDVTRFEKEFHSFMVSNKPEVLESIRTTKEITADNEAALKDSIESFRKSFSTSA